MAVTLGWKDVLRPIRDGYRHLFPTPDTGPTPEERRKRREQDRLKGFTYFDTFEQLEAWDTQESYPLQRANTPLLLRSTSSTGKEEQRASVLLCHDYGGNYHDYESVQEVSLEEEMYACEYLQYIETFVYFSHKLVCVPPPTWTNTLHRNGVKSLGTILVEPQTKDTERLLQHHGEGDDMDFELARKLADIAKHYCFDGWLVNIEKPFPTEHWRPDVLQKFLAQLRKELGDNMQLVWYDALTTSNEVSYQNGVSVMNLTFAEACGSILTNYCWSESQANSSRSVAESCLDPRNVFFGIDVWAQNNTGITHPRTTYPKKGGGGTNTGVAVAKLADIGMSAGIFAPAWSFEHFPSRGREVERTIWEGKALASDIDCSCGNAGSRHQPTGPSIIQHARPYPAGSETFFHTDFARAFSSRAEEGSGKVTEDHIFSTQLGAQSLLPLPQPYGDQSIRPCITHRWEEFFHQGKLVIESPNCSTPNISDKQELGLWTPLYKVNMPADGSLHLKIVFRRFLPTGSLNPSLYLKITNHGDHSTQLLPIEELEYIGEINTIVGTLQADKKMRLEEVGLHLSGVCGQWSAPILEIYLISIVPTGHRPDPYPYARTIHNIRVEDRGDGENAHTLLCWEYLDTKPRTPGMPYSELTGPFSSFTVNLDGLRGVCGPVAPRAYALEHTVAKHVLETLADKEVEVEIVGHGFDGAVLACGTTTLFMRIK